MNKIIYSIGRQYGSDGREIGRKLAEKLNIPYYDKELLARAAEESGLYASLFTGYDEKTRKVMLNLLSTGSAMGLGSAINEKSIDQMVMKAIFDTLRNIAAEGSCVIIGRCADYILAGDAGLRSCFIYAPLDDRVQTVMRRGETADENEARRLILRTDRQRANYYNYYTMKKWGRVDSYDLCLNSSLLGIDGSVELLASLAER